MKTKSNYEVNQIAVTIEEFMDIYLNRNYAEMINSILSPKTFDNSFIITSSC